MERTNRKKIYYVPGIISLTLLPILFIISAQKEIKSKTLTVLTVRLIDTIAYKSFFSCSYDSKTSFLPKRNFVEINLTGENEKDNTKLDFARLRIREITSQNDSVNGIHFKFEDSTQYWAYVKAFDILTSEKAKRYLPINNDIWFFHIPPVTTSKIIDCVMVNYEFVSSEPKISWWIKTKKGVNHIWETSWKIILAFITFTFSIFALRKQKNGSQH